MQKYVKSALFCFHEKQINFVMKVDLNAIPLIILIFWACLYILIDNIYIYYLHKHMGIRAVIGKDVTSVYSLKIAYITWYHSFLRNFINT